MKKIIYIILGLIVVAGSVGFFYYRGTIFSKEILKLDILGPKDVKAGEEIEYTVKYKNNGNFVLENPKITFTLPDYSLVEDSTLRSTKDLEDINPGEEYFIKFKARLLGKKDDIKVAKATLSYVPHNLSARYEAEATLSTKIEDVPITFTYDLSSTVDQGKEVSYYINYFSSIDYPLENLSVKVDDIEGFVFKSSDPYSLDNKEWKIGSLNKGEGGKIRITGTISTSAPEKLNFSAKLGIWQGGNFVVIKETNQETENKIMAKVELFQLAYRSTFDGIENAGPLPPTVGQSTTYVINWRIKNYQDNVKNVKVKAVLPQNVNLNDNMFPDSEASHFSFDSKSREILWLVGDLSPNKEVHLSFQVVLIPNLSQRGLIPQLVGPATVFAENQFTGAVSQSSAQAVSTSLPNDLGSSGGGIVK